MGATPHEAGIAFRVWAPHADAVYVVGSFNDWANDTHPMEQEGGGYWYADISTAAVGGVLLYLNRGQDANPMLDRLGRVLDRFDVSSTHGGGTFAVRGHF